MSVENALMYWRQFSLRFFDEGLNEILYIIIYYFFIHNISSFLIVIIYRRFKKVCFRILPLGGKYFIEEELKSFSILNTGENK